MLMCSSILNLPFNSMIFTTQYQIKSLTFQAVVIVMLALLSFSCRKSNFVTDKEMVFVSDNGQGTGTTTWKSDKKYMIEGFVFVNDGQTLTIEPGTVVHARSGQGDKASALIVARGGKIIANGTSNKPIIFTAEADDLNGSVHILSKGLWGGVIILGNAKINNPAGEANVEGIPLSEPRTIYGGDDDEDDSGILRYVSIRYGGTSLSNGNEINGLTLAGVGRGTIVEYVEVISNADDGFEFFGGTVNARYLISAYNGDNAFDYDEGYRGNGQFWLGIQDDGIGNQIIEADGGFNPVNGLPYSMPVISNSTFIGRGKPANKSTLTLSRNAAGIFLNNIFLHQSKGVSIEYSSLYFDCFDQFANGNIRLENNLFYNIANNDSTEIFTISGDDPGDNRRNAWRSYFSTAGNQIIDPKLTITEEFVSVKPGIDTSFPLSPYPSNWFIPVSYKGAFHTTNWAKPWSLLYKNGLLQL
jgi:hypothetical protein